MGDFAPWTEMTMGIPYPSLILDTAWKMWADLVRAHNRRDPYPAELAARIDAQEVHKQHYRGLSLRPHAANASQLSQIAKDLANASPLAKHAISGIRVSVALLRQTVETAVTMRDGDTLREIAAACEILTPIETSQRFPTLANNKLLAIDVLTSIFLKGNHKDLDSYLGALEKIQSRMYQDLAKDEKYQRWAVNQVKLHQYRTDSTTFLSDDEIAKAKTLIAEGRLLPSDIAYLTERYQKPDIFFGTVLAQNDHCIVAISEKCEYVIMNKAEIVKDKLVSEQLTDSAQTQVLIDNKTPLAFLKYFNTYRAVTADAHLDAEKRYDDALKRLNPPKKVRDRWPIGFGGPAIWDRARIQNKALSKAIRAKLDATPPTRESREISMINIERGPYREADDELKQRFKNLINGTYAMRESELSRSVGLGR